jgi:hypothetical protein
MRHPCQQICRPYYSYRASRHLQTTPVPTTGAAIVAFRHRRPSLDDLQPPGSVEFSARSMTRAFLAAANSCEETMGTVGTGAGDLRDRFASGGAHDRCLQHFNELAEIAESPEWDFRAAEMRHRGASASYAADCEVPASGHRTDRRVAGRDADSTRHAADLAGVRVRPAYADPEVWACSDDSSTCSLT